MSDRSTMKALIVVWLTGAATLVALALIVPVYKRPLSAIRAVESVQETTNSNWSVFFSPAGGCTDAIVHEIAKAKKEILIQAYSFTSEPIAQELAKAHRRGVDVQVIADRSDLSGKGSVLPELHKAGIVVFIDAKHAIAHSKVLIYDDAVVGTGSFNLTDAAEHHNAENHIIIRDKELAAIYKRNWQKHRVHSDPYKP